MENRFIIRENEKNYTVFGAEEDLLEVKNLKITGARFYASGLIDEVTKEKKTAIRIPLGERAKIQELIAGKKVVKEVASDLPKTVPVEKPRKFHDLEDEPSEDKTVEEWTDAFTAERKIKNRHTEIKFLKRINSRGIFYSMEIVEIGGYRFQIYFSTNKTLIFFENYVAVIKYTNDFYEHESVYKRDLKCKSREEFLGKYLIILRNADCQAYNYSQTDIGKEKAIYFYINKFQKDVKKKFITQFFDGIDLHRFETNFLLHLEF